MPMTWDDWKERHPLGEAAAQADADAQDSWAGEIVLAARAHAGLTQDQLAELVGTSQPAVARWEGGRQVPSVRTLVRIAAAAGLDLTLGLSDRSGGRQIALGVYSPRNIDQPHLQRARGRRVPGGGHPAQADRVAASGP